MNKNIFIIIGAVILVAGVVLYIVSQPRDNKNNLTNSFGAALANPTAKMPETNPFKAKVNPMDGYTNPFAK